MKILIFNTLYYPNIIGGAEKSVQLLAELLVKNGHEPVVVSTAKEDGIDYINKVKVYYLNHRNLYWSIESKNKNPLQKALWHGIDIYNPRFVNKINDIILNEKPDVIHSNNLTGFSMVPWIVAKRNNIPVVHTLRDFSLMCSKATMFKGDQNCSGQCTECKVFTSYKKNLSSQGYVSYLVGNSNFMVNRHKELGYFQEVPSSRIFNGTNIIKYKQTNNDYSKRIKFFYMGRIDYTKGVKLLLDTFTRIQEADLYLAGKVYEQEINENIEKEKYPSNIKFLGYIDPNEILEEIDVLIAPSLWNEPLPRVILEGYSYGKPAIGTNRGGIPECILDGKTGYIFNPDEDESLKNIVKKIIENPDILNSLSSNIPNYLAKFDINKTVNSYIQTYLKVTNK
ncbi:glycosyltransferase family 4 protein [Neobacillus cucumis]|uniref:glycosyltransferase family 4 protein n=1 Tax=Neobacillus cucumis TaxID=1740721 RepID=UPI001965A84E|nr:glycosyltransferase family 4 protein [Neobacillus cucumis]MBM7652544.1 glycosyltransferase involved in cell wall biosynthesis [Neobacillus cucumis]